MEELRVDMTQQKITTPAGPCTVNSAYGSSKVFWQEELQE